MSNKNSKDKRHDKVIEVVKTCSKEALEHVVDEEDTSDNIQIILQRLKTIMAKTYISKMIH